MGHEVDDFFKLHDIAEGYSKYKENIPQPRVHFADSGMSSEHYYA